MMGRKRTFNPSAIEQAGQRHWNEAWGAYRTQRNWLGAITLSAIGLAGIIEGRSWFHDTLPKLIPWVIDRNGPSLLTARLEVKIPDAQRIEGHLKDWIELCRSVSSDLAVNTLRMNRCFDWIASPSTGYDKMTAWGMVNNPQTRANKYTVSISNIAVVPQSDKTWLIDWTETNYDKIPGRPSVDSHWRMDVTISISMPETQEEMNANWDGVFVNDWNVKSIPGRTS